MKLGPFWRLRNGLWAGYQGLRGCSEAQLGVLWLLKDPTLPLLQESDSYKLPLPLSRPSLPAQLTPISLRKFSSKVFSIFIFKGVTPLGPLPWTKVRSGTLPGIHHQPRVSPATCRSPQGPCGQFGPTVSCYHSTIPGPRTALGKHTTSTEVGLASQTRAGTKLPSGGCGNSWCQSSRSQGLGKLDLQPPQTAPAVMLGRRGQRSDPLEPPDEPWHVLLLLADEGLLRWPGSSSILTGPTGERLQKGLGQLQPSQEGRAARRDRCDPTKPWLAHWDARKGIQVHVSGPKVLTRTELTHAASPLLDGVPRPVPERLRAAPSDPTPSNHSSFPD